MSRRIRDARAPDNGTYTPEEWESLCARFQGRCVACGLYAPLAADHVIPIICGGANTIGNLQPLCRRCNLRKGSKATDYRPTALLGVYVVPPVPTNYRKTGPLPTGGRRKIVVMLDEDLADWGKQQPGGLSAQIRRLLREARERQGAESAA